MAQPTQTRYSSMIRDLPTTERPRERLKNYGSSSLSNVELLAILLRTGVKGEGVVSLATRVLGRFQGLAGLARASYTELCSEHGISEAKACQLLSALELGRRYASLQPEETPVISSPQDVANLLSLGRGGVKTQQFKRRSASSRCSDMGHCNGLTTCCSSLR